MSLRIHRLALSLFTAGIAIAAHGAAAQELQTRPQLRPTLRPALQLEVIPTEVVPPAEVEPYEDPQSVTLRSGTTSQIVQSLGVRRTLSVEQLRRSPEIQLGPIRADMRPVLQNPDAPVNLATRLRLNPALVADVHDTMEVIEAEEGLIIRQFLTYRMLPGACTGRGGRLTLSRAGAPCFARSSEEERAAARSDPASPRFVAGGNTMLVNRNLIAQRQEEADEIDADIAQLRQMLRDPAERRAIEAEIGVEQAERYARLSAEELEAELVNTGEFQLEEVMFVPSFERSQPVFTQQPRFTSVSPSTFASKLTFAQPVEVVDAEHPISNRIFLTGFTLERSHEWRKRVSITIKWCVVGCRKTYYIEANAGFDYGFGLRLPVELGGTYRYHGQGEDGQASLTATMRPVNGSADDFASTDLPASQIFDGQELVAEVGARAGFAFKVPVMGSNSIGASASHDFTEGLPSPFTNGQFTPPFPGQASPPSAEQIFDNIDLLAGRANFGFVGAKVHPAVKLGLTSDRLELRLTDELRGSTVQITQSGQEIDLGVAPISHASSFSIGDPVYNLGFTVTPGISVKFFVDVKLWSHEWPWDIWFPQLSITLPPGGRDFGCHAQTICSRSYNYSPDVQEEQDAQASLPDTQPERIIAEWQRDFLGEWLPRCPEEEINFCQVTINWTAQKWGYRMDAAFEEAFAEDVQNLDWSAPSVQSMLLTYQNYARQEAIDLIEDAELRAAE